jgi:UDP-N-acetylmuramate: L-alanyl-gamma-D-glutamyl-meso-diaminopimelate ligase
LGEDNDTTAVEIACVEAGLRVRVRGPGRLQSSFGLRLWGRHNVANALAVWAAACADGLDPEAVALALASFGGVRRRLEVLGEVAGVVVVDDFAHHPSAVAESLAALRARFPGRALVALFEPRSLTAGRQIFFDDYLTALGVADRVHLAPSFHARRLAASERLDVDGLCALLRGRGVAAMHHPTIDDLLHSVLREARPGEVLVSMSSGAFDGLPRRLLESLDHS